MTSSIRPRRLTEIGSEYLGAFTDSTGEYLHGSQTYKLTLPPDIPAAKFWSLTVYDDQTRSMLQTGQHYPRAGNQSYPTPAAAANPDGSTTVYFGPAKPENVQGGNWIQTIPGKGWNTLFRLYSRSSRSLARPGAQAKSNRSNRRAGTALPYRAQRAPPESAALASPQPRFSREKNTMSGCLLVTRRSARSGIHWPASPLRRTATRRQRCQ